MSQVTVPKNKDESLQSKRKLALKPVMSDEEVAWLREYAKGARLVVEIGSLAGGSLSIINEVAASDALLVSIDPYHFRKLNDDWDPRARFHERFASEIKQGRIVQINAPSKNARPKLEALLADRVGFEDGARPVDFLHVDGDHRGPAVVADLDLYPPLVRAGGIVCGHDYDRRHVGLREAVDAKYGASINLADAMWWVRAE